MNPTRIHFVCVGLLVAAASLTTLPSAQAIAQTLVGSAISNCGDVCSSNPNEFLVRSYQGTHRCLDYTPDVLGSQIFLNDCAKAHPVIVEELNDGKHTVVLHAGTKVIGASIHGSQPTAIAVGIGGGGAARPAPVSSTTPGEFPLTLQNRVELTVTISGQQAVQNQQFTLDGDSIILPSSMTAAHVPAVVVKVQNARGAIGSPLVVGPRNLDDNEFWDFLPANGIDHDPTSGFVRIGYPGDIYCYPLGVFDNNACVQRFENVAQAVNIPGTVIKLGTSLDLTGQEVVISSPGITIRGDRRGTNDGPLLRACWVVGEFESCDTIQKPPTPEITMLIISHGVSDFRLTGIQVHGPSRDRDKDQQRAYGIITQEDNFRNVFDHNDFSDWTETGLQTQGNDDPKDQTISPTSDVFANVRAQDCVTTNGDPQTRPTTTFIAHNFIHHNEKQNSGYGTESHLGAYPLVMGNTFVSNRHAIAAGYGSVHTGYRAWYNLVLSAAALQESHDIPYHTQDFDMHGTAASPVTGDQGFGGLGGDYTDIFRNTFLGTNRPNFEIRGLPCNYAEYHNNISMESSDDAVQFKLNDVDEAVAVVGGDALLRVAANPAQFNQPNPMYGRLGVGDFDGDGTSDLFVATGTAWYFSPAGKAEWRFLSAKTEKIDQLLFGDFDGDGRTDVLAIHNGQFVVSWGGISDWEVLNANPTGGALFLLPTAITQMATGDFDGGGISDVFFADGQTWWVSYGGVSAFALVATSSFRVKDLRFGDFDGNGTTDVFGVGSTNWQVSYSPKGVHDLFSSWQPLRRKLTDNADGLVVADFNGDGFADVAQICGDPFSCSWHISYGGFEDWHSVTQSNWLVPSAFAAVGNFRGYKAADMLFWNGIAVPGGLFTTDSCDLNIGTFTHLCISIAGFNPVQRYSTQDMR